MSDTILLGHDVKGKRPANLDLQELVTGRTFVCGTSGFGKSHTGRYVSEHVFGKAGLIIVDVEGEYASLREKYPFLIIGKDLPLVPEAAEYLADQVLENELSVIIDGSDINTDEAVFQEFVQRFTDRFLIIETAKRKPYLFITEESDELAPEQNFARSLCGPAMLKLAKKGRKRGCGLMTITQRPQGEAKGVVTQCGQKMVGHLDWPGDKEVVQKYARIPKEIAEKLDEFKRGDFYVSGEFIDKPRIVHIGPVQTKHVGETPEVVPPAPKELAATLAKLNEQLPSIIQERLAPAVPKVAEIEARLKTKFEAQWEARVKRVEKERDGIKNKTAAKYEVEIADLKRKLDEQGRTAALQGGMISDVLKHPMVVAAFTKAGFNERELGLIDLLENKGPKTPDQLRLFLGGLKEEGVRSVVRAINEKIPGLIEREKGQYVSRLPQLFPVTEEVKAEAKESEVLRGRVTELEGQIVDLRQMVAKVARERDEGKVEINRLKDMIKTMATNAPKTGTRNVPETGALAASGVSETSVVSGTTSVLLKRTVTDVQEKIDHHALEVDKTTLEGKVCILVRENPSFIVDEKSALNATGVGKEIERRFNITVTKGGNLQALGERLGYLVAEGVLDRKSVDKSWVYWQRPEFHERVKGV